MEFPWPLERLWLIKPEKNAYAVIFDESFNTILQLDKMDIIVRYWQVDKVVSRY